MQPAILIGEPGLGQCRAAAEVQDGAFRLTAAGLDLFPLIAALLEWGNMYAATEAGPPVLLTHRDCGAPVGLQLACADGHVLQSPSQVTPVRGPGTRKIA